MALPRVHISFMLPMRPAPRLGTYTDTISLRWSDDRGHTYGNPVSRPQEDVGTLTSLQWLRLGMARDRVFEISWSAPIHTSLQGAWVEAEAADEDNEMAGQGSG
jgi:hypothetical protein